MGKEKKREEGAAMVVQIVDSTSSEVDTKRESPLSSSQHCTVGCRASLYEIHRPSGSCTFEPETVPAHHHQNLILESSVFAPSLTSLLKV